MTIREIERRAVLLLRQYETDRDRCRNQGDHDEARVYIHRLHAILEVAELLGCKRSRIVAAVKAESEVGA